MKINTIKMKMIINNNNNNEYKNNNNNISFRELNKRLKNKEIYFINKKFTLPRERAKHKYQNI